MSRPRLLAAFCGVGGCTRGYQNAGWDQGDAVDFIRKWGHQFDAAHAGPPCQHDCTLTAGTNAGKFEYPDLLEPTREALKAVGIPFVIEQPPGKASKRMRVDLTLCGEMFGLEVLRHRNFELGGWEIERPQHVKHRGRVAGMRHGEWFTGPYFAVYGDGGGKGSVADWQRAMGIDWTDVRKEIAEAIPPAYGEFIGRALMAELERRAAA